MTNIDAYRVKRDFGEKSFWVAGVTTCGRPRGYTKHEHESATLTREDTESLRRYYTTVNVKAEAHMVVAGTATIVAWTTDRKEGGLV